MGSDKNDSVDELVNNIVVMAGDITKGVASTILTGHPPPKQPSEWRIMVAGAVAGLVVDTSLFPIDTIKSRLQSKAGFIKSGGFSHLYRGLMPVLAGSVPNGKLLLDNSTKYVYTSMCTYTQTYREIRLI